MALRQILIDEATLAAAPEPRRVEWRAALQELLEEHEFSRVDAAQLWLSIEGDLIRTRWQVEGSPDLEVAVARGLLVAHLDEYTAICRRMGSSEQGLGSASLEALDMAKRVAHDSAARSVQRLFKPVGPDHPTARRLFTLLLTRWVDTTRLTMLHVHRPFRAPKGSV